MEFKNYYRTYSGADALIFIMFPKTAPDEYGGSVITQSMLSSSIVLIIYRQSPCIMFVFSIPSLF